MARAEDFVPYRQQLEAQENRRKAGYLAMLLLACTHINPNSNDKVWCFKDQRFSNNYEAVVHWVLQQVDLIPISSDSDEQELQNRFKNYLLDKTSYY